MAVRRDKMCDVSKREEWEVLLNGVVMGGRCVLLVMCGEHG